MPNLWTEDWSAFDFQRGASARQRFLGTGYSDAESARAACPVQQGDRFLYDPTLIASMPIVATPRGSQNYWATVQFSRNPGGSGDDNPDNLLTIPPRWRWNIIETTEPVDRDFFGNAITSSTLEPFAENPPDTFHSYEYIYKRYERVSINNPGARYKPFLNAINDGGITLPGFGDVGDRQARLVSITPDTDADRNTKAVLFTYKIEIRDDLDDRPGTAWKLRLLDRGRRAHTASGIVPLYTKKTDTASSYPVTDDVLLNGYAAPVKSDEYVGGAAGEGFREVSFLGPDVEVVPLPDKAAYLYYTRRRKLPFQALGLVA